MCDHESVQTYDPHYTEEHTDSSDFECPKELQKLKKNKLFLNKELLRRVKMKERDFYMKNHMNYNDFVNKLEKKQQRKRIQVPDRCKENNKEYESIQRLNKPFLKQYQETNQSRSEIVLRDKVITRFSNIFKHANSYYKYKIIEENHDKNDHACQVYSKNCKNCMKRLKKRRQSNLNTVHELKRQTETPYNTTQIVNYSAQQVLRNINRKNSTYAVLPIYSSASSELDVVTLDSKEHQEHSLLPSPYKKNMPCQQQDKQTKISYIYPKRRDYQVFSGFNNQNKDVSTSSCNRRSHDNISRARSSVFWEYMINKIQQRCRHQRLPCSKPCHCGEAECDAKKTEPVCCNNKDPYTGVCCSSSFNDEFSRTPQGQYEPAMPNRTQNKKIQCKCPSDQQELQNPYEIPMSEEIPVQDKRPCQQDHDLVTKTLAEKYNGEILCIHNPPCILINGCLNVGAKENATPLWYVTQDRNISFLQSDKTNGKKYDRSHSKYIDVMQYYQEENRIEREIQSACHHNPPCKFVRQCCKPRYSPKLDCCCVHVPMCKKVPECLLALEGYGQNSCKHKPKCTELPLCAKDWLLYGEINNVQSEVKRNSELVCQHNPPCIKIPKCLGRMMCEGFIPYDAIPDCVHQPPCDRIPACFRRTPKMISAYSQYPAPCRIV